MNSESGTVDVAVDLAALLASRICHDLISPIGAIGNGVELLELAGLQNTPELSLIMRSVGHASARVRFFRIACGTAAPSLTCAPRDLRDLLEELSAEARVKTRWHVTWPVPRPEAKAAFLAIMCLETMLPLGGQIDVTCDAGWQLTATGPRVTDRTGLWQDAMTGTHAIEAADLQFWLLPSAARRAGLSPALAFAPEKLVLSL